MDPIQGSFIDVTSPLNMYSQQLYMFPVSVNFRLKKEGHRPLRLVVDRQDLQEHSVEVLSTDTGVGMSTLFHHIEPHPNTLVISRGSGCTRQLLPRHGQLKGMIHVDHLSSVVLQTRGTLDGGAKRKLHTLDASEDEDPFADLDQCLEEDIIFV